MFETGAAVFDLQPPLHVVLDILYLYSILYSTVQYSTVQYRLYACQPCQPAWEAGLAGGVQDQSELPLAWALI
jgi:hypothetical protein